MSKPSASPASGLNRRSFMTGTVSAAAAVPLLGTPAKAEEPMTTQLPQRINREGNEFVS